MRITHGRHCVCSACAREDWTNPQLAPCGMHGASCPPVYAPLGRPGECEPVHDRADQLTSIDDTPDREPDLTLTVNVYDLGPEPEWHKDRSLYGPWNRWRARFVDGADPAQVGGQGLNPPFEADCGQSAAEAIRRAAGRFVR